MVKKDAKVDQNGYTRWVNRSLLLGADGENPVSDSNRIPVDAELEVSDIQIGAVEIKDGDTDDRVNVTDKNALKTVISDENGNFINQVNPPSNSIDKIYEGDIDFVNKTDNGNFTGSVADYFNSLITVNEDTTANNPKAITIWFKGSQQVKAIGFGCDDITKNFSNIKVIALGSGNIERGVIDESTDNTKYNSRVIDFSETAILNGVRIEFVTSDPVGLSNIVIFKSIETVSEIIGARPDGGKVTFGATNQGNFKTSIEEYGDTPAIDSFGKLRVTTPQTIFDSKQLHDKLELFWDEIIAGGATSVHFPEDASTRMTVTNPGDYVQRQTKQRFNYQPGKSQLILMTFTAPEDTTTRKRIGAFDGTGTDFLEPNNGIFFQSGNEVSWNIAKDGSITESVLQTDWNVDKFDGSNDPETNPSGLQLDLDGSQILIIDYEWLGVGRVRVGFVVGGLIYYCHYFNHANLSAFPTPYMSTPNLALRYSIESITGAGTMDHICSTVISEGGIEETGILRTVDTDFDHIDASTTNVTYAIVGIRLKSDRIDTTVIPESISMINENNDDFRWSLHLNPTVSGTLNWVDRDFSSIQSFKGATNGSNQLTVDSGTVLNSGYASIDTLSASAQLKTALKIGSNIDGTRDILVLAVTPLSGGADVQASLGFRELL